MFTETVRLDSFLCFNVLFFYRRKIISVESDVLDSYSNEELVRELGNIIDTCVHYHLLGRKPVIYFVPIGKDNVYKISLIVKDLEYEFTSKAIDQHCETSILRDHKLILKTKIKYKKIYKILKKIQNNRKLPSPELITQPYFNYSLYDEKTLVRFLKITKKYGSIDNQYSSGDRISDFLLIFRAKRELELRLSILFEIIDSINNFISKNIKNGFIRFKINETYISDVKKVTLNINKENIDINKTLRFLYGLDHTFGG
jgi:hypothetical protein